MLENIWFFSRKALAAKVCGHKNTEVEVNQDSQDAFQQQTAIQIM